MKFKLMVLGKTREAYIEEGIKLYLERLKHYAPTKIQILKPVSIKKGSTDEQIKNIEGKQILTCLQPKDFLVALDQSGKNISSKRLATFINDLELQGINQVVWVIGGPLGISKDVLSRANMILSLSAMTFTHDMSRLILLEQLYRAMTIKKGEKYHK